MENRKHFELNDNEKMSYQTCSILLKQFLEGIALNESISEDQKPVL